MRGGVAGQVAEEAAVRCEAGQVAEAVAVPCEVGQVVEAVAVRCEAGQVAMVVATEKATVVATAVAVAVRREAPTELPVVALKLPEAAAEPALTTRELLGLPGAAPVALRPSPSQTQVVALRLSRSQALARVARRPPRSQTRRRKPHRASNERQPARRPRTLSGSHRIGGGAVRGLPLNVGPARPSSPGCPCRTPNLKWCLRHVAASLRRGQWWLH